MPAPDATAPTLPPVPAGRPLALFPGQGSQRPGMAAWIHDHPAAREVFARADEALAMPLTELCTTGTAQDLQATDVTQPAVVATSLALAAVLKGRGWQPAAVAGHSLGEFSALAVADVLSLESALLLVRRRGELMARVARELGGSMVAVIGLPGPRVEELCREVGGGVDVANYNEPEQTVVSGQEEALLCLERRARQVGASKVVQLRVGGAFHSRLMAGIAEEFARELERHAVRPPSAPVLSPVTAEYVEDPQDVLPLLRRQLTAPVRWVDTVRRGLADGYDSLLEIGPGRVLTGFARRIAPDTPRMVFNRPDGDPG